MNVRRLVYGLLATNILALAMPVALVRVGAVGHSVADFHQRWITTGAIFTAAACCLLGALHHRSERAAWLVLTGGVGTYGAGQLYYSLFVAGLADPPYPSPADPFWLALYPAIIVCIALLLRARQRGHQALLWIDGLIVGLGVAAIAAALVYPTILASVADADPAAAAVTLAYPSSDLLVVVLTITVFGLAGWRPGRAWLALGAGLLITTATDTAYAWVVAQGQLTLPQELFSGWGIGMTLLALAAWQPSQPQTEVGLAGSRALVMPTAFAVTALALLIYGNLSALSPVAVALATATLAAAIARGVLTFHEARALAGSHELAHTDPLTGLLNRRALKEALEAAPEGALLALYDLDGFKQYNDRFGHHEGDLLLTRLAHRLDDAVRGEGQAFRLAGDEFCVLTTEHHAIQKAADALTESGSGFAITASYGIAGLHEDGATPNDILRLADARMYQQKFTRGPASAEYALFLAGRGSGDAEPELEAENGRLALLAGAVGARLGLSGNELDELVKAARVHDVGKLAISDSILGKPGLLTDEEWALVRRHTLIGERMLLGAPALASVAGIVRCTHERYDGQGYPDGLAHDAIPLAARIIAVCDSFDAMTSWRPYRPALTGEAALEELQNEASHQFDPAVVRAFISEMERLRTHKAA